MPKAFDAANPPFDRLTPNEVETLRAALDIAYFRPGEAIIEQNTPADALYVVIKGMIEERTAATCWRCSAPKTVSIAAPSSTARADTPFSPARRRYVTPLPKLR